MPDVKTTVSKDFFAKMTKNTERYQPKFANDDKKQFERNVDAMLQNQQVKQAMTLLADA